VDALAAPGDPAIRQAYDHVTKPHQGTFFAGSGGTAQRRTNPRQQLGHAEGFAQVVVGASVERLDLIMLVDTRGQNDDGHRAPGAYLSNEARAVTVRQTQIENDEIGLARAGFNQAALQGVRLQHAEAFHFQGVAHEAPDLLFILDDQNSAVRVEMAFSRIHGRASGSRTGCSSSSRVKINRAPWGVRCSAQILPSCASMIASQIASPRPVPGMMDSFWPRANFSPWRVRRRETSVEVEPREDGKRAARLFAYLYATLTCTAITLFATPRPAFRHLPSPAREQRREPRVPVPGGLPGPHGPAVPEVPGVRGDDRPELRDVRVPQVDPVRPPAASGHCLLLESLQTGVQVPERAPPRQPSVPPGPPADEFDPAPDRERLLLVGAQLKLQPLPQERLDLPAPPNQLVPLLGEQHQIVHAAQVVAAPQPPLSRTRRARSGTRCPRTGS